MGSRASTSRTRVFFAIWPDARLARSLYQAARHTQNGGSGRLMRADTLHLTLAFLGDVAGEDLSRLIEIAMRIKFQPFELQLDRIGYWKHNAIVWAGTAQVPPALTALAESLADALRAAGFRLEERSFKPHITLVRKFSGVPVAALQPPLHWQVDRFRLVISRPDRHGARYELVGEWPAPPITGGE